MALKTLKPRLQQQGLRLATLTARPDATPRMRGRKWMSRRASWLEAHPLCCECTKEDRTTAAQEVDHIVPLWKGGADDETNYASLCVEHHKAKTAREAKERGFASSGSFWQD